MIKKLEDLKYLKKELSSLREGISKRDKIDRDEFDELYHYQNYLKGKIKFLEDKEWELY